VPLRVSSEIILSISRQGKRGDHRASLPREEHAASRSRGALAPRPQRMSIVTHSTKPGGEQESVPRSETINRHV
jgi:hypothetical protein